MKRKKRSSTKKKTPVSTDKTVPVNVDYSSAPPAPTKTAKNEPEFQVPVVVIEPPKPFVSSTSEAPTVSMKPKKSTKRTVFNMLMMLALLAILCAVTLYAVDGFGAPVFMYSCSACFTLGLWVDDLISK